MKVYLNILYSDFHFDNVINHHKQKYTKKTNGTNDKLTSRY